MKVAVVSVVPGGLARVDLTSNVDQAFRRWRNSRPDFLPVAAFAIDRDELLSRASILRLPWETRIQVVADLFHRAPVMPFAHKPVFAQCELLGDRAAPLLESWRQAVDLVSRPAAG